jgi:hypothetical protein
VAKKAAPPPVKQVYKPKQREEVQKMEVDPERTTGQTSFRLDQWVFLLEKMEKDRLFQTIRL